MLIKYLLNSLAISFRSAVKWSTMLKDWDRSVVFLLLRVVLISYQDSSDTPVGNVMRGKNHDK